MPKADFPSYIGVIEECMDKIDSMDVVNENGTTANRLSPNKQPIKPKLKYLIDTMSIKSPRPNMNVQSFLKDGLVEDWNAFEKVLEYAFVKHLKCDPSKHPILMTEPVTNTKIKREKLCELVFEKFQSPGFYLAKNGVLSAYNL